MQLLVSIDMTFVLRSDNATYRDIACSNDTIGGSFHRGCNERNQRAYSHQYRQHLQDHLPAIHDLHCRMHFEFILFVNGFFLDICDVSRGDVAP